MKKLFFISGLIAILGMSVFLGSCNKENKECTCTVKGDGETYVDKLFPVNYGAKNCSELAKQIKEEDGWESVSCK
jgi:hypothetical protein